MIKLEFSRHQIAALFLISGFLMGATVTYFGEDVNSIGSEEAGERAVSLLEKQNNQELEIINVQTESNLYRVDISNQNDQLSTFYVTKDGSKLTREMVDIEQIRSTLNTREEFSNCLSERVVMYGNMSQQQTQYRYSF